MQAHDGKLCRSLLHSLPLENHTHSHLCIVRWNNDETSLHSRGERSKLNRFLDFLSFLGFEGLFINKNI